MIYYGAKELAFASRTVRGNTIIIAQEIPEDKYGFKAAPECRTVAQLLTHIAITSQFQHQIHAIDKLSTFEGFDFPSLIKKLMQEEAKPRTKAQILDLLKEEGEKWAGFIEGLSDDFLGQRFNMPAGSTPPFKSRFEMILSVKEHEMHHRGQLMVMERMMGIVPHLTREREARLAQAK
jgi:uncharacterized damage-inducible protein DinB